METARVLIAGDRTRSVCASRASSGSASTHAPHTRSVDEPEAEGTKFGFSSSSDGVKFWMTSEMISSSGQLSEGDMVVDH